MSRKHGFNGIVGAESALEWAEESVNWKLRNVRSCYLETEEKTTKKKVKHI